MVCDLDFDPELFGLWPKAPEYDGLGRDSGAFGRADIEAMARDAILDRKAQPQGSPLDALHDMLNGMTQELRQQMQQFRLLREQSEERLLVANEEIDRKTVQADAKASIEAMSVIVRTLEKIDSLQRTIAQDRQMEAERTFDEKAYRAFVAQIEARIETRAQAIAADQQRDDGAGAGGPGAEGAGRRGDAGGAGLDGQGRRNNDRAAFSADADADTDTDAGAVGGAGRPTASGPPGAAGG